MMYLILAALGRSDRLEAMRRGFTSKGDPGSDVWQGMVVISVVGFAIIGGLLILNRAQLRRSEAAKGDAASLFREVLGALHLGVKDRALLRRIASEMKLENPTVALLTPELFAEFAYTYIAAKPGAAKGEASRLASICKAIFDVDMPPPKGAAAPSADPSGRRHRRP
jgi:hypothetical protein